MSTPVEQIKERLSIVDVVGGYVKLTKAGSSYKALCPFHHEKSPSFNVSPSRDAYYCFGCNRGGDIFTFVEEIEGIEFVDALRILADRAGVELKRGGGEDRSERDRLLSILEEACLFYERHLLTNSAVKEYLVGRGLSKETVRSFRIGYAPNEWRLAYEHLKGKGYTDDEIEKAGLIKYPDNQTERAQDRAEGTAKRPYDRFRGRVMFPIFDQNGRPIAFSGRIFGEEKGKDGQAMAKYVNSPEGLLYDKSSVLFGYDRAKKSIREQNFVILVEGQMDLIMAHQAGTLNTVAVSGTALTEKHLALLKRQSDNLVFAFDADDAGLLATARAFSLALASGMNVRVAAIPEGKDPADYIKAHPEEWSKVIASSTHIIDFYLATLAGKGLDQQKFREEVQKKVLPLVTLIRSKIEAAHFVIEIARKLGVPEAAVWEDVRTLANTQSVAQTVVTRDSPAQEKPPKMSALPKTRRQVAEDEIWGILLWQEGKKSASGNPEEEGLVRLPVESIKEEYHKRSALHGVEPYEPNDEAGKLLAMKAEYKYEESPELARSIDELLDTWESEVLREKQADLWKELSNAEARGDKERAKAFLESYQAITPALIALEDRRLKRGEI